MRRWHRSDDAPNTYRATHSGTDVLLIHDPTGECPWTLQIGKSKFPLTAATLFAAQLEAEELMRNG